MVEQNDEITKVPPTEKLTCPFPSSANPPKENVSVIAQNNEPLQEKNMEQISATQYVPRSKSKQKAPLLPTAHVTLQHIFSDTLEETRTSNKPQQKNTKTARVTGETKKGTNTKQNIGTAIPLTTAESEDSDEDMLLYTPKAPDKACAEISKAKITKTKENKP
ncbi:hypothetical protein KM043_018830 [Ampulex compressa]|nr:hypothetical protein KM043_018830 [Ampulex compressa]